MVTDPQTNTQTNPQTGPITIHCAAKLSAQCNQAIKILGVRLSQKIIAYFQIVAVPNPRRGAFIIANSVMVKFLAKIPGSGLRSELPPKSNRLVPELRPNVP